MILRHLLCALLVALLAFTPLSSVLASQSDSVTSAEGQKSPFRQGKSNFAAAFVEVAEGIPAVLSKKDVKLYRDMFRAQRELKRETVVKLIPKLDDKKRVLMGNLIAERLLHPRTKVPYADLKAWLARYHDQAQARQIYRLANHRKPRSERHHKPTVKKNSLARYGPENYEEGRIKKKSRYSKVRGRLLYLLKRNRIRKNYGASLTILEDEATRKTLGTHTWHEVSLTLARYMMYDGAYEKARDLSAKIIVGSPEHQPEALWVNGFSAYRLGDKKDAVNKFRRLAYTVPTNSTYYAKAAWWTARTYEELGQYDKTPLFINMAAQDSLTFYGQMAMQRLNRYLPENAWKEPNINSQHRKGLFNNKAIRRVIALVQIGEHGLAQQELKTAYESIPYDWDESLLALSLRLDLPATSVTLARNLMERKKLFLTGLYPIVSDQWQPRNGAKVDTSMMHAVVRQESAFNPKIKSRAGARGLMQVMPATARFIQRKYHQPVYSKVSMYKPDINMMIGQRYVMYLENKFKGNLLYVISSYNAGPGNVRKWIKNNPSIEKDPVQFIESIPFNETRKYVTRVLANLWMYRKRFQQDTPILTAMSKNAWPVRVVTLTLSDNDG